MRSLKIYLVFILLWCLSTQLMSQCIVDVEKQITESEVCISIDIDFDVSSIDKIIISDEDGNEDIYHPDSKAINWCYDRKLIAEEKHIKIYVIVSGQPQLITPNYTQRSSGGIVIIDGM